MAKASKKISEFSLVQGYLTRLSGGLAVGVVKICERKTGSVTDEELAKKLKVKVTEVRTILNRLHYAGIACYKKTKNRKTGWYSYTWAIKPRRVIELLLEEQAKEIEKLESKQRFEKDYTFFICKDRCSTFPFEIAAEYQFKCPACGKTMDLADNEKMAKGRNKQISDLKKEVEELRKIS
ncbi:MAG: hypothetical protein NTW59_00600 [Candidatus Diapherotrites archaeon]|nr:hypothetical protein [Candidatus Diapherotrites archaeon]